MTQRDQQNRRQTDQHRKPEHAADVFAFHAWQAHQRVFEHRGKQNADHFDDGDDHRTDAQLRRRQQVRVDDEGDHREENQAEFFGEDPDQRHQSMVGHGARPERKGRWVQALLRKVFTRA
jgi:hypothetical protein